MDRKNMEENGMKARNFRKEDYNNRRAFLRSYTLQWEKEDNTANEEMSKVTRGNSQKNPIEKTLRWEGEDNTANEIAKNNSQTKPIKKMAISIFHWGEGQVVILRRFKDKFTVYVIACIPTGFKPHKALISA